MRALLLIDFWFPSPRLTLCVCVCMCVCVFSISPSYGFSSCYVLCAERLYHADVPLVFYTLASYLRARGLFLLVRLLEPACRQPGIADTRLLADPCNGFQPGRDVRLSPTAYPAMRPLPKLPLLLRPDTGPTS